MVPLPVYKSDSVDLSVPSGDAPDFQPGEATNCEPGLAPHNENPAQGIGRLPDPISDPSPTWFFHAEVSKQPDITADWLLNFVGRQVHTLGRNGEPKQNKVLVFGCMYLNACSIHWGTPAR